MTAFIGIRREQVFSPGKVTADAAVLDAVAERLRAQGHSVTVFDGDAPRWPPPNGAATVFTMCQGEEALARLRQWEARGVPVVNSTTAVLNCQRQRTLTLLQHAGIPFPDSVIVETAAAAPPWPAWASAGAWIKRGDFHATQPDDVVRADDAVTARAALAKFRERGIGRAILQQHAAGVVVKFYAVRDAFFQYVRPDDGTAVSGEVLTRMRQIGARAARVLGVEIYGGDCVYDPQRGTLSLIDLNDWPSYASCRAEAATHIAAYLHARGIASRR